MQGNLIIYAGKLNNHQCMGLYSFYHNYGMLNVLYSTYIHKCMNYPMETAVDNVLYDINNFPRELIGIFLKILKDTYVYISYIAG